MSRWVDRVRGAWSRLPSCISNHADFLSSAIFLVTSAHLAFRLTRRADDPGAPPPVPPAGPRGDLPVPPPEPRGYVHGRLEGPLRVIQDAMVQEVLVSWMLAEAFGLWLWVVDGMDVLLDSYWVKMAELFLPSSDEQHSREPPGASRATVLPRAIGDPSPGGAASGPDLSGLPFFLEPMLRPSFLKPVALFLLALSPLALLRVLNPPPPPRDENNQEALWHPWDRRERWNRTEVGTSGYFLEREPALSTNSPGASSQGPTTWQSAVSLRASPGPERPFRRGRRRHEHRRRGDELKITRST